MVIKALIMGAAALAGLSAGAAQAAPEAASDYAAAAITSGQLGEAERALQPASYADVNDPARLINIATVYARTARLSDAQAALMQVRALPAEQLELANGVSYSSHQIAGAMLKRLGQ